MRKLIWLPLLFLLVGGAEAEMMRESPGDGGFVAKPTALPNTQIKVHRVGKVWLTISNYGFFGNPDDLEDPDGLAAVAPSCMFPGGSNLEYLFGGYFWLGAVKDTVIGGNPALDTLVSIGADGWWSVTGEFYPDFPPNGGIEVRSTRPPDVYPYGDTVDAISEQDFIAVYSDTHTNQSYVTPDPNDQRQHIPLGIEVTQKSYAWSYEYAEDFVLFDFDIVNMNSDEVVKDVWVGLYIDADVLHSSENPYGNEQGAQDDLCGFDTVYVDPNGNRTTINTAYICDNDGQVYDGTYDYRSPRGLSGVRVVRTPSAELEYGFNWWISNVNSELDWGPQLQVNFNRWGIFPGGGRGTPGGDKAKYQVMSNGEFDYDQIWCALDWTDEGWIPGSSQADDLANGYDTRYLFSFGPFAEINPGDTLKLTTAYICGENLHVDPSNYSSHLQNNTGDEGQIAQFYDNLDFRDFRTNSQWADWVYDNPGVDTDTTDDVGGPGWWVEGEHFRITPEGDTFWFKGDGVPDFKGPPPPPSPRLRAETSPGVVQLIWDGSATESEPDIFSGQMDFEGYRIYMSRTGRLGEYTLLGDYDLVDFDSTYLDSTVTPPVWKLWKQPPRRLEAFVDFGYPADFDPDTSANWVPHSWNNDLSVLADDSSDTDTLYTFTVRDLSESVGMYFAVTAYDYGNPVTNLSPLESSQTINARYVYAITKGEESNKVAVYPNPYRIDVDYAGMGYEDPDRSGFTQFDRRIWFSDLPGKCTIRIFTLDGDLVRQIDYDPSTNPSGVVYWDLISRNTQAVVSGIYIYVVDADNGHHELGKIAIIK
jgi:hypothetical protein